MNERSIVPGSGFMSAIAAIPPGRPVVMINLLRYAERADYPAESNDPPCSGKEAYARYSKEAFGFVAGVGGNVEYLGTVHAALIAPDGEAWDEAILVRYPSVEKFIEMVTNAEYQAITYHRTAALSDSRLIATEPSVVSD